MRKGRKRAGGGGYDYVAVFAQNLVKLERGRQAQRKVDIISLENCLLSSKSWEYHAPKKLPPLAAGEVSNSILVRSSKQFVKFIQDKLLLLDAFRTWMY